VRAAAAIVSILVVWVSSYATGVWPWIGTAWMNRSSFGAGSITIVGESRMGTEIGFDDFVFFDGQEVVIDYETEIHAGSLWFHVFQPFDGNLGDGVTHYVTESGKGTWTTPITRTGFYHVTIEASVVRGGGVGWDLSYSVKWGARPATAH
jgi:hypothetical protein